MSDETPGAPQGALLPREGQPAPRVVAERPVRFAGGQFLITTSSQPHGVPAALTQITPGSLQTQSGVTRLISLSPSRINQHTSPLRPSQANQSIVNVLTKSRPNSNVRLQLFSGGEGSTAMSSQQTPSPTKTPIKRQLPSATSLPDKKDTYSSKLQRVMNHRIVKSKLIKEKYNEHLMEAYFLEAGGNILDLYQFAKKPKTQAYLQYLKEHSIDPKESSSGSNSDEQIVPQTTPVTPTATAVSSLPGMSHTPNIATTKTNTPIIHHQDDKLNLSSVKLKTPQNYSQQSPAGNNQEQMVEKAKQEAYVVQRINDLQKEGLWSEKRLPKVQEMHRAKAHWDFLLEEMVWLAADFAQERKWKKAAAKKCARMVQKYFQDKTVAAQKAEKAQEQHIRRIAGFCAKEIRNFWNNVEKLVEFKQHTILEEKRKKALDQQLSFIVDQTEKYSQLLAEGMNRTNNTENNVPASTMSSRSASRANSDDEFRPDSQNSDDDEETIEQEEAALGDDADQNEEVAALQRESEMDLDDFLKELPKDYLQNRDSIRLSDLSGSEEASDNEDKNETKSSKSDEDFSTANITSDEDDEDTIQEQEKVEGKQNHQEELDDLRAENDLSIEELRKKYSGPPPAFSDADDDSDSDEDEPSDDEAMETSEENETSDVDMIVSENDSQGDDIGLQSLLEDSHNEGEDTKTDKNNDLINDAAAIAESIQPKGNTLSSTNVSTKVPFLLKLPLREYQHIGLDWLVTMYDRKLNGILADEMGLGKTIQTIALLSHLACEKENWGPHLIVVPTSVMLNWEMECKKWSPAFKILTYYGTQKERKLKRTGWTKPNAFHICITSYKLVIQDHQSFRRKKWKYLILDEAQNIKNFKSQRWQLLLNFQTQQRLLLTGTPLQNNLMELWSLMHFLMPNVFQSHREFKEWFSNPVTGMIEGNSEYNESIIKRLHKVLRPFLLRRLKSEVEKQMPKKYEHVIMCRLSKRQRFLYDDYMSRAKTRETLATGNLLSVINVLMQLRKVCNHPNLFEVRPTVSSFLSEGILLQIPSLIYAALEYDVWKHIDLYSLNLNFINMELHLGAYQSYRMRQIRTPAQIIEMNVKPEQIPPPPPCRLMMRIKKGDEAKPCIKVEKKDLNGKNQQNIKVKVAPQYGVQILQQQGIVKAIPVNIANQSSNSNVTSMLKPSDKISASFAQLVQTSTGKHLLLTSNPNIPGNIPVSTTTPGGQKLTFLSKQSLLTSGTTTHPITKAFMKIQLTSVSATTTNTVTTANTSTPTKSEEKGDRKMVGNKFIEQLYANQSNNLDVRWSNDIQNNDDGSSDELDLYKDELKVRLGIMSRINERRCSAIPLYGEDFRRVVSVFDENSNIISSWNGSDKNTESEVTVDQVDALQNLIYNPERRINELKDICDRFIFYVPAVRASEPELQVWHPSPSVYWGKKEEKKLIQQLFSGPATPLHHIASAMVTQFPDPRLIQYDCGKLQTLDKLLRKLKNEGHRVLIFTQMTKMLDVLEAFLNFHGHIYLRLDGTTKVDQRQLLMERFNGDKRLFAFILSTRSGGIGVNLTGADTVIFYDSDWNPTMDAQAQDRCHRIGQTRDVHIYRLVSERTIEENILKKANQKRLLGDLAIEGGNFTTAYFKSSTIQDLFNIDASEESAAGRMSEVMESREKRSAATVAAGPSTTEPGQGDDKVALGALENALAACEDDQDVQAARTAKAEAVADLAEFDENIPLDDQEREPEMSKAEQEIDKVIKKLSPIELYAMKFIEQTESAWSAEQLAAAEREIEEQKREWEKNRLAAMREEEERRARELEEENDLITFSREDATNQIWVSDNTMEQMPMWCPPTPPQQDTDIYIDHTMSFLYDTNVMSESQLPPIYVKREAKRPRLEAGFVDSRRPAKIPRKEDVVNAPKSIFYSTNTLKTKQRDIKMKYRGLMRNTLAIPGKVVIPKPAIETPLWHDWTIHEDMALLKVIQIYQGLPLNLMVTSPGHTPNWDFVADYVNTLSITYRSPKQCRHRYETVLIQREEGKQIMDQNALRKKKNKTSGSTAGMHNKYAFQQKSNRPMRTSQLYTQDNNATFSQDMIRRYDAFKAISTKPLQQQQQQQRSTAQNPQLKNPKHTAMLTELGIDLDRPVLPVEVAARRTERMQREKKPMTEQTIRMMKGMLPSQASSTTGPQIVAVSSAATSTTSGAQVAVTQTVNVVATVSSSGATVSATPPNTIRSQRIISSPLQASTVVSVSGLSPAQLQAATQRLIVASSPGPKTEGQTTQIQAKSISPAQLQLLRQQAGGTFKPQLRLQTGSLTAQGVKTSISGQQTVVQFTQAQSRGQFVRQGTVTVGGKSGITRTVDCDVTQLLKKQQQQKTLTAGVASGAQASTIQGLPSQVLAQAVQQAGSSGTPVATLVKTVSNTGGVSQTVTIPVSGVSLATGNKAITQTIKATTSQQLRQIQLHQQQQLLAQKKLNAQKLNIAQVSGGKNNVQTQLIVGSKPTAMTVQQLHQVMQRPLQLSRTPLMLAKGTQRVIPVNTSQGTKQTIQVVAATSQALNSALRPQGPSTLAGALAGIKVQGQGGSQAQHTLLSHVSAALQNQTVSVRQGSPVRLQTASGASIVAVTVQPTSNIQQQGTSQQSSNIEQVSKFMKK